MAYPLMRPKAFSDEVDSRFVEENATKQKSEHFPTKWIPGSSKKMRQSKSQSIFRRSGFPVRRRKCDKAIA
jgi:hypothetical protein